MPPPAGVRSPVLWGDRHHLGGLLGDGVSSVALRERTFTFRHESARGFVELFLAKYGPTERASAALDPTGQAELRADMVALVESHDRLGGGGAIAVPSAYLEAVAVRR